MNSLVRSQSMMPTVGTRQGDWIWDGSRWVCDPDCDFDSPCLPVPCPPTQVTPAFFPPPVFSGPTAQPPWYPGANGGVSFGQNPPANPVRGHLFWDGTALWLFDGAVWVNTATGAILGDGGGVTPGPTPTPGSMALTFAIAQVSAASVAAGWLIAPINGQPVINTNGTWNVTTKQFTPSVAGVYNIEAQVWVPAASFYQLAILKNDSGGPYTNLQNVEVVAIMSTSNIGWITLTGFVQMNGTTDFVRMWLTTAGGTFDQSYGFPVMRAWKMP